MNTKWIAIATVLAVIAAVAGCARERVLPEVRPPETATAPPPAVETEKAPRPDPRIQASLKLTEQGRRLLAAGQPDSAIRMFEQAISLNPRNGQNYYYLAEAWLAKGQLNEAREFNRLAETYLKQDPTWMLQVTRQADRIAEQEK